MLFANGKSIQLNLGFVKKNYLLCVVTRVSLLACKQFTLFNFSARYFVYSSVLTFYFLSHPSRVSRQPRSSRFCFSLFTSNFSLLFLPSRISRQSSPSHLLSVSTTRSMCHLFESGRLFLPLCHVSNHPDMMRDG